MVIWLKYRGIYDKIISVIYSIQGCVAMKMRSKILLFCLLSTLFALILQTFLFQNASSNLIYSQEKENSRNTIQNMQNEINSFFKSVESNLIEIYNESDFIRALRKDTPIEELRENYYRMAYNFATEKFKTADGVVALYIYNIDHEIISTYRKAVTPKHNYPVDIYENEELFNSKKVKDYIGSDNTKMLISSYFNIYRNTDIIRLVLKIYDNTNIKSKKGYIVCDIDSKVIKKIMNKYCNNEDMFIWLQPLGDRPLLTIGNLEEDSVSFYEKIVRQLQDGEKVSELTKEKPILLQAEQKKYNLHAYSIMPQSLLKQNQKVLNQNLILIASIMCILITILSLVITRTLTKPLEQLTETIAKIRQGNTHQRVGKLKNYEIGKLAQDFNEMLDEIEYLISREYETKLLLNKAEYKALQAQINPHFLYNTLDTMSSIASVQNCPAVSELCQSLSSIFRYSLDFKNPYSTVAKEIMHLKNYIYVMNVRMGNEVDYQFNISESVLQDSIPRLSIQPLVENALKHGLRNKRGLKKIIIEADEKDGKLNILVKDNGIGMDAEQMNNKLRENNPEEAETGSSIGLFNINARLKMLYGKEYGLTIESQPDEGTCVSLIIPRRNMEEYDNG